MSAVYLQQLFPTILGLFTIGAIGSLIFRYDDEAAHAWSSIFSIVGSLSTLVFSLSLLMQGIGFSFAGYSTFPALTFSFTLDHLSVFFVFVISLIALAASVYGYGYAKQYIGKYNLGTLGFFYNSFILGMLLVVTSSNILFFLIAWEVMSVASYFLVIYERHEQANIKAGTLYFVMTHVGTAFITLAFLLMFKVTGSLDFGTIKLSLMTAPLWIQNMIFVLALIGFGTKAGIIPFHIWLPSAHPAAPSHVSALMSGVMIKTGIYMFIRIFFDLLGPAQVWWGVTILILGAISALLGVLYALSEHDLKRLLAYHSIENIGIIMLGLGSSLVFLSFGMKALALIGLIAALFHTMNHAVFKGLLFLGAGSVIHATHTRNIEKYGGLIRYMPQTAFLFLIGAMAISALPPLNGFASEWLTFQAMFSAVSSLGSTMGMIFVLAIGALAFTSGLAAACFVKAFGITFLARPRSDEAKHAHESSAPLLVGMYFLATLTLIFGVFAGKVTGILTVLAQALQNMGMSAETLNVLPSVSAVHLSNNFANMSLGLLFVGLVIALALIGIIVGLVTKNRKLRRDRTWDCGTELLPRMEITATGFSRSLIVIFKGLLRPTRQTHIEYHDAELRYFPKKSVVHLELKDIYLDNFYAPVQSFITRLSNQFKRIQSGNTNLYIVYMLITLIALLVILAH
ncbi:MAG: hydrogenase 4 subunit B [Candidatus Paceibacterota bacterium]|jgi:hydrogenase-4 component B